MSSTSTLPPYRVLADHPDFLAIHKMPGVSFHGDEKKPGLLQLIRSHETEETQTEHRLFPVHRLDQVTSGVMIFARGRKNANQLANEFRFKRTEKIYIALSQRVPKKKRGVISGDMEKSRNGTWILKRSNKNPAITLFQSRSISGRRPGLRLFILKPLTGKTHQIRSALKSLGSPILGDPRYDRFDLAREEERTYLHAIGIKFKLNNQVYTQISLPETGSEFLSPQFKSTLKEFSDLFAIDWKK